MPMEIKVPSLGQSVPEATVGKWLKKVGDQVATDEAVVELETDKINMEVTAFREVFLIPREEEANAARVYNLARQDAAGFEEIGLEAGFPYTGRGKLLGGVRVIHRPPPAPAAVVPLRVCARLATPCKSSGRATAWSGVLCVGCPASRPPTSGRRLGSEGATPRVALSRARGGSRPPGPPPSAGAGRWCRRR